MHHDSSKTVGPVQVLYYRLEHSSVLTDERTPVVYLNAPLSLFLVGVLSEPIYIQRSVFPHIRSFEREVLYSVTLLVPVPFFQICHHYVLALEIQMGGAEHCTYLGRADCWVGAEQGC